MSKNTENQIQQGDVIGKRIMSLPSTAKLRNADPRGLVLAEGEMSGHFHAVAGETGVNLYENGKTLILENTTDHEVVITHQEHNPVKVPPGIFEFGQVQEFDYFQEAARQVRD